MAKETPRRGLLAEFANPRDMTTAVMRLEERGYRKLDTFAPYEVEEVEGALGAESPEIPWWGAAAGVVGGALAYAIQWYANAWDYPLNVGGRPLVSTPAWLPIVFETAVLFAAITIFVVFWFECRLPALWHPVFEVEGFERASTDRFWVAVDAEDGRYHPLETAELLDRFGALRVLDLRDDA